MAQLQEQKQEQKELKPQAAKRSWIETVRTDYLIHRLSSSRDDRITTAAIIIELADRAERNPSLQELLRKTRLPAPFDIFEYKRGNLLKKGHWARRAYTREFPTQAQLEARIAFAETAYLLFGTKGNVERENNTTIAKLGYLTGEQLRGKKIVTDEEKEIRKKDKRIIQMCTFLW